MIKNTYKIDHPAGYQWWYWYDTDCRTWYAATFNKAGDQLSNVIDAATKEWVLIYIGMSWHQK